MKLCPDDSFEHAFLELVELFLVPIILLENDSLIVTQEKSERALLQIKETVMAFLTQLHVELGLEYDGEILDVILVGQSKLVGKNS